METYSHDSIPHVDGEISENTFEERREIINFTEDDRVLTDAVTEKTDLSSSLLSYGTEPREHTVKAFLQRPVKISTVTWTTSQAKMTNIASFAIPNAILVPMYREKLKGFGLLRADVVFKLQFNTQPFQAGRLIAVYTPVPAYLVSRSTAARASLCRLTSLPNVVIDISKTTECNITLPYVSSFTHFDLTTGGGDWGQFDIYVYSPLSSASTQTVNISVRTYLDNIHLGAPTQHMLASEQEFLVPVGSQQGSLQSGVDKVIMNEERSGPISNMGHDIRQAAVGIANSVGERIPALSKWVGTANGLAMAALNTFAAFGLGKPKNLDKTAPRCLHAFSNFAQATGIDNGHILGLDEQNRVKLLPGFAGSDTDELSVAYLMQTLQYYDTHTIRTTDVAGTPVSAYKVTPFQSDLDLTLTMGTAAGQNEVTFPQPNLQWYVGSNFKYWRGDTILHIGLVKTDYHSLRLKIVYDPMATDASQVQYENSDYCYSVVVDFRDKTDVYIRFPFISPTPWKNIPMPVQNGSTAVPAEQSELLSLYSGYVRIFIDNELQASSTVVSDSIEMITEICGASNVHLGYPYGGKNWVPIARDYPHQGTLQGKFTSDGIMKTRTSMQENTFDMQNITGMPPHPAIDNINDYTTGETVESLRALIKRFNWVLKTPTGNNGNFIKLSNAVCPKFTNSNTEETSPFYGWRNDYQPALVDVIGSLYAFRTGGFRWKCWDSDSSQISCFMLPEHAALSASTIRSLGSFDQIGNTAVWEIDSTNVKGAAEFICPFYHPTYTQINAFYTAFTDTEPDTYFHFTQPQTYPIFVRSRTDNAMSIAKAAGDDFNLGFLLGVPFCVPSNVVTDLIPQPRPQPSLAESAGPPL